MQRRVLLAAVLILVVPAASIGQGAAQSGSATGSTDTVTFYGHVFGNGLEAPMPANTEAPTGEANYGIGLGGDCSSHSPVHDDCQQAGFNKLALFSTAGIVDVETRSQFLQGGGYGQFHNERGQTKDILLDTSQSITASVYVAYDLHGWFVGAFNDHGTNCLYSHPENVPCVYPSWGWDPGVFPNVVVEATLYKADLGSRTNTSQAPPVADAFENEPTVVAHGQWGPDTVMNGVPGSPNVNEFEIDLGTPQVDSIDRNEDFFLVYSTHRQTPDGGNECLDCDARWWSGEFFPPTFKLPVKNAFTVERVVPNFAHGKLAMLGIINTPWGSYDVDQESIDLTITGPDGSTVNPDHLTRYADFSVAHGGHYKPVNVTWVWDYARSDAPTGNYTVSVSASNFQHSASAECETWFTLERGGQGRLVAGDSAEGVCGTQSVEDTSQFQGGNQTSES